LHSTHLRTAAVGGLVDIGGREKADGFWALWAAGLPFLKMAVNGPDLKNDLAREGKLSPTQNPGSHNRKRG